MNDRELIAIEELEIRRGSFTLHIDSWNLKTGEVVGLVGPNGAGKTTLLESIAGLQKRTRGLISVLGADPWLDPSIRTELGFMSDDMPLFSMRIGRLLRLLSGYYPNWDKHLVENLLERFKIDPGEQVHKLSKGQGTRLRLITAMAFRPRILLLDEPATGLDINGRRSLLASVLEVVHDPDRSVVISSHMLTDVERVADRLVVLDQGRIIREGATSDLIGEERTLEEALLEWGAAG